jgi:hypothetical protein
MKGGLLKPVKMQDYYKKQLLKAKLRLFGELMLYVATGTALFALIIKLIQQGLL